MGENPGDGSANWSVFAIGSFPAWTGSTDAGGGYLEMGALTCHGGKQRRR
jgi:hypothetical protein